MKVTWESISRRIGKAAQVDPDVAEAVLRAFQIWADDPRDHNADRLNAFHALKTTRAELDALIRRGA